MARFRPTLQWLMLAVLFAAVLCSLIARRVRLSEIAASHQLEVNQARSRLYSTWLITANENLRLLDEAEYTPEGPSIDDPPPKSWPDGQFNLLEEPLWHARMAGRTRREISSGDRLIGATIVTAVFLTIFTFARRTMSRASQPHMKALP